MAHYRIDTRQVFDVTYIVEAESRDEAWATLTSGDFVPCEEQFPGPILGTIADANITKEMA